MTEEELRKQIKQVFDNYYTSLPIERRHLRWADQILTLIREAGWKSPEEVEKMCYDAMIMGRK